MSEVNLQNIWPGWQIVRTIGQGSYGVVYEAVHEEAGISSRAAVKVISIPQNPSEMDSLRSEGLTESQSRTYLNGVVNEFVSEIQLMNSFKGTENIVSVEDYRVIERQGEIGWDIYIRMELLTPFTKYISDKTLDEQEIIRLGTDLCTALDLCAKRNVIHRDIKPENIFVNAFGGFKLGDFGIARTLEHTTAGLSQKGTVNYMAPEVYRGTSYTSSVDIYSLGLVLYFLANNRKLPFLDVRKSLHSHSERMEALNRRLSGELLPPPCNASKGLSEIILTACAPDPRKRFRTAAAMKNALIMLQTGKKAAAPAPGNMGTAVSRAPGVQPVYPGAAGAVWPNPVPMRQNPAGMQANPAEVQSSPAAVQPNHTAMRPQANSDNNPQGRLQQQSGPAGMRQNEPDQPKEKKKRTGLVVGLICALVLLLAGGGFLGYKLFFGPKESTKEEPVFVSRTEKEKTKAATEKPEITEEPAAAEYGTEEPQEGSTEDTETAEEYDTTEEPVTEKAETTEPATEEPETEKATEELETEPTTEEPETEPTTSADERESEEELDTPNDTASENEETAAEDVLDLAKLSPKESYGLSTEMADYYSDGMNWKGSTMLAGEYSHNGYVIYSLGGEYVRLHLIYACNRGTEYSDFTGHIKIWNAKDSSKLLYNAEIHPRDDAKEINIDITGISEIGVEYNPGKNGTVMLKDLIAVRDPETEIRRTNMLELPEVRMFSKEDSEIGRNRQINAVRNDYESDGMNWKGAITLYGDSSYDGYTVFYLGGEYKKLHLIYACNRDAAYSDYRGTIEISDTKGRLLYKAEVHPRDCAKEINIDVTGVYAFMIKYNPLDEGTIMLKDLGAAKDPDQEIEKTNVLDLPEEYVFADEKAEIGRVRQANVLRNDYEADGINWKGSITLYGDDYNTGCTVYYLGGKYTTLHLSYTCYKDAAYTEYNGRLLIDDPEKNRELYKSDVNPKNPMKEIEIDVSGANYLRIEYDPLGEGTLLLNNMTAVK